MAQRYTSYSTIKVDMFDNNFVFLNTPKTTDEPAKL
ncbi:hypothetical protein HDF22_005802 [Mucilaginibacter lappiensis]|uniref:Uncharacterized protein n=1 Tax=Mucilaginibacter lappiensis TaxID=354630 RepID=A0A841JV05_9SPHI|nr:hypothetical protein [Mucilaginibacter lappiensis]